MTTNIVETESTRAVVTENDVTNTVEVTSPGPAGPPGGRITIQDNGVSEGLLTDKLNFVGSTVSVVNDTLNEVATVTVNAADPGANANITSMTGIAGGISSPDFIQFDTAAAATGAVGRMLWNDTDGTLEFQMKGGNVTLQVGQEEVLRVTNQYGTTMVDGQVVYITGSTGNHLNVTLSQANSEATSSKTLAVVTETIANNQSGFATTSGLVRNLDTSALTEGAAIWLSPTVPGGLTSTKPVAPNHAVLIGWCVRQHASVGVIYVHIANGYELDELHNVLITSVADKQVLRYDSATSLWKNVTISPTVTLTGAVTGSGTMTDLGSVSIATTATADPTLTLAGDATGAATFTNLGNATLTVTVVDDSHNHIISNVDGLQSALDAKLASADYTAADVLTKIKTVDGAGSGLDADLLDGQSSAYYTAINDRLGYTAENAANKGVANGYASLDGAGLVPSTQLPSYVDDVLEYANLAAFPATGVSGVIYVAIDTSKTYRWTGSVYVEISASPGTTDSLTEGSVNLYFTQARARQSVSAGTGISYDNSTGVITNSAPDQTVALTGSGTTSITGTYPNFTVSSSDQYVGTVTSVGGTGTVNGITLTGTVTTSGSLTLGGTLSGVSLTSQVSGTLPVANGGTGASTLTSGYLVKGNGTSAVSASVVYDNGTNVGIGTSSPAIKLDVNGTARGTKLIAGATTGLGLSNIFEAYSATYGVLASFRSIPSDGINSYLNITTSASGVTLEENGSSYGSLMFNTSATERVRIDSSGNLGIGTSAPQKKLVVSDAGNIGFEVSPNDAAQGYTRLLNYDRVTNLYSPIRYQASTQTWFVGTAGTTRAMDINTSGNVGIGTSSPGSRLHSVAASDGAVSIQLSSGTGDTANGSLSTEIRATSASGTYYQNLKYRGWVHSFFTGSSERMRIDGAGNVGIGTSSPTNLLHLFAAGNTSALIQSSGSGTPYLGMSTTGIGEQRIICNVGSAQNMTFYVASAERMRIDTAGNVGIGTASPDNKLNVSSTGTTYVKVDSDTTASYRGIAFGDPIDNLTYGNVSMELSTNNLRIANGSATIVGYTTFLTSGAERMRINASGNVGIGTTAPNASAILDVQSTTKGFRLPNMTTTQKNAIASPAAGLMVFDTTLGKACLYTGSAWQTITSA